MIFGLCPLRNLREMLHEPTGLGKISWPGSGYTLLIIEVTPLAGLSGGLGLRSPLLCVVLAKGVAQAMQTSFRLVCQGRARWTRLVK
jgi:hypothetical protein